MQRESGRPELSADARRLGTAVQRAIIVDRDHRSRRRRAHSDRGRAAEPRIPRVRSHPRGCGERRERLAHGIPGAARHHRARRGTQRLALPSGISHDSSRRGGVAGPAGARCRRSDQSGSTDLDQLGDSAADRPDCTLRKAVLCDHGRQCHRRIGSALERAGSCRRTGHHAYPLDRIG